MNAKQKEEQRIKTTTYVTKDILERIRSYETEDFRFNRALSDDYLAILDPVVKLPVVEAFAHEQWRGPYKDVMRVVLTIPKLRLFQ